MSPSMSIEQTFGVLDHAEIQDVHVLSTTGAGGAALLEDPTPAWSPTATAGTYPIGTEVHRATTHRVYSRLTAHTAVEAALPENNPNAWKDMRPTNRWAWSDMYRSTRTVAPEQLTITLRPQTIIDTVWVDGVEGSKVTIEVTDGVGGPVVLPATDYLLYTAGLDWQTFFLQRPQPIREAFQTNLPLVIDPVVTIAVTASGGSAAIGNVRVGRLERLGWTEYEAAIERRSFSRFAEQEDGSLAQIVKRPGGSDISVRVLIDPEDTDRVNNLFDKYDAKPALWVGHTGSSYKSLRRYGVFTGRLSYETYGRNILTGTIRGMI